MTITNPDAIKFANESIRVSADRLAKAYYLAILTKTRWDSLGGGQPAIDVMKSDIRMFADHCVELYEWAWRVEKRWFLLGGTNLIPNTSEDLADGAPGDGRPASTGQKCVSVVDRVVQFQNWLLSSTGSFTDTARASASYYNTVLAASSGGPGTLSEADAGNLITRCGEIKTNYEASSNTNLGTLLALAVNPNP